MTNRNETDTNEMATIETNYQTDFYSAVYHQYSTNFYGDYSRKYKIPRNWDRDTKYRFGISIFIFLCTIFLITDWHH